MSKPFNFERVRKTIQRVESGKDLRKPDREKGGGGPRSRREIQVWHPGKGDVEELMRKLEEDERRLGEELEALGAEDFKGESSRPGESMSAERFPNEKIRRDMGKRLYQQRGFSKKRSDTKRSGHRNEKFEAHREQRRDKNRRKKLL